MIAAITPVTLELSALLSDVVGGQGHRVRSRYGIELRLNASDSLFGLGESSPFPGFSPDTLDSCRQALNTLVPVEQEMPQSPAQCRDLIGAFSSQLPDTVPSARFAVEGALLDLFAKHLGLSAAALLASIATLTNQQATHEQPTSAHLVPAQQLAVSRLLPSTNLGECLAATRHAWARGYRVFKLKLGPGEDLEQGVVTLRALRDKYGSELGLRLDPNGSWPVEGLDGIFETLAPFEPELIEEPVPFDQLLKLDSCKLPLALDESLIARDTLSLAMAHRERLNLRAVILKPALHGLLRSLELAELARNNGLDVIVTHLFDGPVGHATATCLALAVGSPHRAHGLAPHPGLLMAPNRRIAGLGHGRLWREDTPGLPLLEVTRC